MTIILAVLYSILVTYLNMILYLVYTNCYVRMIILFLLRICTYICLFWYACMYSCLHGWLANGAVRIPTDSPVIPAASPLNVTAPIVKAAANSMDKRNIGEEQTTDTSPMHLQYVTADSPEPTSPTTPTLEPVSIRKKSNASNSHEHEEEEVVEIHPLSSLTSSTTAAIDTNNKDMNYNSNQLITEKDYINDNIIKEEEYYKTNSDVHHNKYSVSQSTTNKENDIQLYKKESVMTSGARMEKESQQLSKNNAPLEVVEYVDCQEFGTAGVLVPEHVSALKPLSLLSHPPQPIPVSLPLAIKLSDELALEDM